VPWNVRNQPNQLESEIKRAHIAIIPSDPNDLRKAGISHNRLVDAVRGGCIAIASPMESYKELEKISILGNNFAELLDTVLEKYEDYCQNLIRHREELIRKFSPEQNILAWTNFWEKIIRMQHNTA
jgi:hypothetical protein